MPKILLPLAALSTAVLLAAGAKAQSGRKVQSVDLRPLSVTAIISIEEFDGHRVVKGREFKYELYFKDDGTPDTTTPVVSAFKLKNARVRHFDYVVKADPASPFVRLPEEAEPGLTLLRAHVVFDPVTGRPDYKIGGAMVKDKNGQPVTLLLSIRYRRWRVRKVRGAG